MFCSKGSFCATVQAAGWKGSVERRCNDLETPAEGVRAQEGCSQHQEEEWGPPSDNTAAGGGQMEWGSGEERNTRRTERERSAEGWRTKSTSLDAEKKEKKRRCRGKRGNDDCCSGLQWCGKWREKEYTWKRNRDRLGFGSEQLWSKWGDLHWRRADHTFTQCEWHQDDGWNGRGRCGKKSDRR